MGRRTKNTECEMIKDHLIQNGGVISQVIKALDLNVNKSTVQLYFNRIGFDQSIYRLAYKRYGLWEILPGKPRPTSISDLLVEAKCHGCGTVHTVHMSNLRAGKSTCCSRCSKKGKPWKAVRNTLTNEVHQSMRGFAKSIGKARQYQTVRNHLVNKGFYDHNGHTYVLA